MRPPPLPSKVLRPLRRMGIEWKGVVPVITTARVEREIGGGPVRLDAGRLYCLQEAVAADLLSSGLAVPGEPPD